MAVKNKDQFAQFMSMGVTMSAANTLTFSSVAVGTSIFDYAAFLLHRVEYKLSQASLGELTAATDFVTIAVTGSNSVADIFDTSRPDVYDMVSVAPSTTTGQIIEMPFIHDFSDLPGGGLLVPAQDMFIGMQSAGFAAAGVATLRLYYTIKGLDASDYIELAQRLRVLST